MATTNVKILNPADKTRFYTVATGTGVPSTTTEELVANVKKFPIGSQYTDVAGNFFVRIAAAAAVLDWKKVNA